MSNTDLSCVADASAETPIQRAMLAVRDGLRIARDDLDEREHSVFVGLLICVVAAEQARHLPKAPPS